MNLKKLTDYLLVRIIIAIILGIIAAWLFGINDNTPGLVIARIFTTFAGLFSNFLGFFVPVLIFALITPAIASLGRGAGKWLGITTAIAYGSTIISGFIAYALSQALYPALLAGNVRANVGDIDEGALEAYFSIEMPAPLDVMTALLLAFTIGVAMTAVKSDTLYEGAKDLQRVIMKVISKFIIPLLPIYIFAVFMGLGMNGKLLDTISAFAKVIVLAIIMTWVVLLLQYLAAGAYTGRNPFTAIGNMLPAYATALGTSSSAATIPVTYASALKNGISEKVAGFVIPLCATIHLSGSMQKIALFAFAIVYMDGMDVSFGQAIGFVLMLGIFMIAAPGVPGGAIMAAVGLLQSSLGFDESQVALMIAAYIAIDSFGTACNVTGDGAIAMVVNKMARGSIERTGELDGHSELDYQTDEPPFEDEILQ
ncbi:MAG: dicarboxylate/amino acid:cation symporter [Corynebacterium sp.]|nr:dicarboxylate/amino acid:cation symporter [Corynebacterium sp.]